MQGPKTFLARVCGLFFCDTFRYKILPLLSLAIAVGRIRRLNGAAKYNFRVVCHGQCRLFTMNERSIASLHEEGMAPPSRSRFFCVG